MTHIQKAVKAVGDNGRYQKILLGFFILMYIQLGLMLIGSTFTFMNPSFQCAGMDDDPSQDDACNQSGLKPQCTVVNAYTATAYAGLICDKQTDRNFIQSALYIGAILGLLFLTPFADSKGKKRIFVLSQGLCVLGLLLNIIGVYSGATFVMIMGQIILGSGCYCILIIGYVILGQLTQDKFKQIGIITLNAVWALSEVIIAGLYFWYNQWYNFMVLVMLIPNIGLLMFSTFYLVESPFYLIEKKQDMEAALSSLRQIALINNQNMNVMLEAQSQLKISMSEVEEEEQKNVGQPKVSNFAIFKDFKHLKILLLVAVVEIGVNAYYYGVQFSLGKIGTNFGYNIMLTGIIEFLAFLSSNLFITKIPRKMGMIACNVVSITLGLLFFFDFPQVAETILLGACRWFNAYALGIVPFLQSQPFPHIYRSSVWGYIQGLSQIGNFITPYIVTGCENANINPLLVFSFMLSVMGIVPMFFIKETLNKSEEQLIKEDLIESHEKEGVSLNSEQIEALEQRMVQ